MNPRILFEASYRIELTFTAPFYLAAHTHMAVPGSRAHMPLLPMCVSVCVMLPPRKPGVSISATLHGGRSCTGCLKYLFLDLSIAIPRKSTRNVIFYL